MLDTGPFKKTGGAGTHTGHTGCRVCRVNVHTGTRITQTNLTTSTGTMEEIIVGVFKNIRVVLVYSRL